MQRYQDGLASMRIVSGEEKQEKQTWHQEVVRKVVVKAVMSLSTQASAHDVECLCRERAKQEKLQDL